MPRTARLPLALLCSVLGCGACGPAVDLASAIQVEDLSSGWVESGPVSGLNKVVPALSFTLKNSSGQTLPALQVNVIFRHVNSPEEWDDAYRALPDSNGLAPGAATGPVRIDAARGYTGSDSSEALLRNSQFVDAKADLFARTASTAWKRLGEFPITRRMLAHP
jgi:hypothetical protein